MQVFSDLLEAFNLQGKIIDNLLIVKKWNWDYESALEFQKASQKVVQKNKNLKIYIFCNHSNCFTLGRGNERGVENLIAFDQSLESNLKYPVHRIKRGGGITFHYPGQWIFYPIVALGPDNNLSDLMKWMLNSVREVISHDFGVNEVIAATKLVGVWYKRMKLASIGMGTDRFITEHGLALNLVYEQSMFQELKKISPCGMNPTTYTSLDQVLNTQDTDLVEKFHNYFLKRILLIN